MGVSFSKTETVESLEGVSGCQLFRVAPKYTVKVPPYPCTPGFCSKAAFASLCISARMSCPVSLLFLRVFQSSPHFHFPSHFHLLLVAAWGP